MREIHKKIKPEYFEKILSGEKTFEFRVADFECEPGDILVLEEWEYPVGINSIENRRPTGRVIRKKVGYVGYTKDFTWLTERPDVAADYEKLGAQIISLIDEPEPRLKVGIGVMIKDGNKILLGHRCDKASDTGGIFEPGAWTFPGGKQEYEETIFECAAREIKEETNLDISECEVFNAADDMQPDRHFITVQVIAHKFAGEPKVMEPTKIDEWKWFDLDDLPENIYSPTRKFAKEYLARRKNR